jgi:hypothetical protein
MRTSPSNIVKAVCPSRAGFLPGSHVASAPASARGAGSVLVVGKVVLVANKIPVIETL